MNRVFRAFAALALLLVCCGVAVASPEKVLADGSHVITYSIPDMECAMCARSIKTEIHHLSGIADVQTDDASHVATVRFDPTKTDARQIEAAIHKAGFACKPIESPH